MSDWSIPKGCEGGGWDSGPTKEGGEVVNVSGQRGRPPLTLHDDGGDEDDVQNDDDAKDGACDYDDGDDHEKCCYFIQKKKATYH